MVEHLRSSSESRGGTASCLYPRVTITLPRPLLDVHQTSPLDMVTGSQEHSSSCLPNLSQRHQRSPSFTSSPSSRLSPTAQLSEPSQLPHSLINSHSKPTVPLALVNTMPPPRREVERVALAQVDGHGARTLGHVQVAHPRHGVGGRRVGLRDERAGGGADEG